MMKKISWPTVSIITPTLNSERTLEVCLSSIISQDYRGKVEIIIADGGSSDKTVLIAKGYGAKVVVNKLRTGEAGKAVGAKKAKGEIIIFIDSDNVLPQRSWLKRMVMPLLEDSEIVASEPLYFTYRKKDYWLTRYFALLGMGDPLNLFIGNYDRYSILSNKWTQLGVESQSKRGYLLVFLKDQIPTIGANGFLVRREILKMYPVGDYLFDIDILRFLTKKKSVKIAKVKIGIVHLFSGNIATFIRKQRRRIRDYLYFKKIGARVEERWGIIYWGVIKFTIFTLLIFPLFIQVITGYRRKKDYAWFFHPLACWLTLLVYGYEIIRSIFVVGILERKKWSQ